MRFFWLFKTISTIFIGTFFFPFKKKKKCLFSREIFKLSYDVLDSKNVRNSVMNGSMIEKHYKIGDSEKMQCIV